MRFNSFLNLTPMYWDIFTGMPWVQGKLYLNLRLYLKNTSIQVLFQGQKEKKRRYENGNMAKRKRRWHHHAGLQNERRRKTWSLLWNMWILWLLACWVCLDSSSNKRYVYQRTWKSDRISPEFKEIKKRYEKKWI